MVDGKQGSLGRGVGGRIGTGVTSLGVLLVALAALWAPSAMAGVPEFTLRSGLPTTMEAGQAVRTTVTAVNNGTAPFTGKLTMTATFPTGVTPLEVEGQASDGGANSCEIAGQESICSFEENEMQPIGESIMWFRFKVEPGTANGQKVVDLDLTNNAGANEIHLQEKFTVGPPEPFELNLFAPTATRAGAAETQAGAAPEIINTEFSIPGSVSELLGLPTLGLIHGAEHFRNIIVHSPPGLVANLDATPVQCTAAELTEQEEGSQMPLCPQDSQVGTIRLLSKRIVVPVYNMVPPHGVAAEFGFYFSGVAVIVEAHMRPSDFGFDLVTRYTNSALPLTDIDFELWGVPADPSHDTARGLCLDGAEGNTKNHNPNGICTTEAPRKAFLRLPTSCQGPLDWNMEVDSYESPGDYKKAHATTPAQVGCNQLEFTPSLKVRPTTNVADSPSGLEFNLHLPQNEDPDGVAEAELKNLRALLPEGLTVNPASADGLGACSPQQIGLETPVGQLPAHFNGEPAHCPDSSKLGSVSVYAPALGHTLPGEVYLASQEQNPFGSLLALYLDIDDPQSGIIVKVPVKVEPDPVTGRLTTVVEESAPLPFEDLKVELDPGPHASLTTPISCGTFATSSDLTPWSAPEGQDAHPADSFEISKGAGGGACVSSEAAAPSKPSFEAGTLDPRAGAYSPFVLKLGRQDGTQRLTGIDTTLPKGLLARLSGATYCSETALAAAAAKKGRAEEAQPSCPASSQVGTVEIADGAGPAPFHLHGKAYLAGPYKGAPLSLAVITPAVAGPFDIGTVVVRAALNVNPETTQVRAVSDPFPHIIDGLPVDIRQLAVSIERPQFTLNPTSCDPMSLTASVGLLSGQSAALSNGFQVGGCAALGFKPKLALGLKGGTTRSKDPALTATLTMPPGGANIAMAQVGLPHSEFLNQAHIKTICTRVQYAAGNGGGEGCPKGSIYGTATAWSPLLEAPLSGPVYLRSSSHQLPDLVASLNGQFHVDLDGRIDSFHKGIRTTFEAVPDAPVSKFVLKMQGGRKGLLQNSTNICRGIHRATVLFDAQNGKVADSRTRLQVKCPKSRAVKGHRR